MAPTASTLAAATLAWSLIAGQPTPPTASNRVPATPTVAPATTPLDEQFAGLLVSSSRFGPASPVGEEVTIAVSPRGRFRLTVVEAHRAAEEATAEAATINAPVESGNVPRADQTLAVGRSEDRPPTTHTILSASPAHCPPGDARRVWLHRFYDGDRLVWARVTGAPLAAACADTGHVVAVATPGGLTPPGASTSSGPSGPSGPSGQSELLLFKAAPGGPLRLIGWHRLRRLPFGSVLPPHPRPADMEPIVCLEPEYLPVAVHPARSTFMLMLRPCAGSGGAAMPGPVRWWTLDLETGDITGVVVPEQPSTPGPDARHAIAEAIPLPGTHLMVVLWLVRPDLYADVEWHVALVDAHGRERWATSFPAQMSVIDGSTGRPRLRRMDELVSMARGGVSISGDPGVFAVHLMAPRDDLWFEVERAAFDHDNLLADAIPRPLTVRPLPGETSSGSIPPG